LKHVKKRGARFPHRIKWDLLDLLSSKALETLSNIIQPLSYFMLLKPKSDGLLKMGGSRLELSF
jgi:hypothetical protein